LSQSLLSSSEGGILSPITSRAQHFLLPFEPVRLSFSVQIGRRTAEKLTQSYISTLSTKFTSLRALLTLTLKQNYNLYIPTLCYDVGDLKIEYLWIGATDLGREGDFYWDGIGDVIGPFTNWNFSQPDNSGGNEHCVHMYGTTQYWNDRACYYLYRYLCEGKIEEDAILNIYKV
jgi:hypothetical protein